MLDASDSVELASEAEQDLKEDLRDERTQLQGKESQLPIPLPLRGEGEFERFSLLGVDLPAGQAAQVTSSMSDELVRSKEEAKQQELVARRSMKSALQQGLPLVASLKSSDVVGWLQEIGLGKFASTFGTKGVDGR